MAKGVHLSMKPQHLSRYRDIASLLFRLGRSDLVSMAGLDDLADRSVPNPSDADERTRAEELTAELERLGPSFVKLGQLLASRTDLLPAVYTDALSRLQDACEPFSMSEVEKTVQRELGTRLSRVFPEFDDKPLAAASLGQVHRAKLRDGRMVAVKVQRPGVREQMVDDLEVLGELVDFVDAHSREARRYALTDSFHEVRRTLIGELDYRREAGNLTALRTALQHRSIMVVPAPLDDLTSGRLLTMDYIAGRSVADLSPLARLERDLAPLADELFGAYLEQILQVGTFHADPHPANVMVTDDGRLALIDVGMVGHLSPQVRRRLAKLMVAVINGRSEDVVRVAEEFGTTADDFDPHALRRAADDVLAEVTTSPLGDLDMGRAVLELCRRSAEAGLRPDPALTMLGKTLLQLEQVASILDPGFEPVAALQRHVPELMRAQLEGGTGSLLGSVIETKEFIEELPGRVNRAMDAIAGGHFQIRVQAFDEEQFLKGLHKLANVAAAGVVLAALLIGSALLASSNRRGTTSTVALVVFVVAAVGALLLVAGSVRSSRRVHSRRRG